MPVPQQSTDVILRPLFKRPVLKLPAAETAAIGPVHSRRVSLPLYLYSMLIGGILYSSASAPQIAGPRRSQALEAAALYQGKLG